MIEIQLKGGIYQTGNMVIRHPGQPGSEAIAVIAIITDAHLQEIAQFAPGKCYRKYFKEFIDN